MTKENQIIVDITNEEDIKKVLNALINNKEHWDKIIERNKEYEYKGLVYGRLVDGKFEAYGNEFITSENKFFEAAVLHNSLVPLVIQYIQQANANQWFDFDTRMGMSAVYQLAMVYDKYIPLFIEHHRKIRPGGGEKQMEHIIDLLSDSDNGIRLLAACCLYIIDLPDIEYNLEYWIEDFIGEDKIKQEKLFQYIVEEAVNIKDDEFLLNYIMETLDIMKINYNEELLETSITNNKLNNLPNLSSISSD